MKKSQKEDNKELNIYVSSRITLLILDKLIKENPKKMALVPLEYFRAPAGLLLLLGEESAVALLKLMPNGDRIAMLSNNANLRYMSLDEQTSILKHFSAIASRNESEDTPERITIKHLQELIKRNPHAILPVFYQLFRPLSVVFACIGESQEVLQSALSIPEKEMVERQTRKVSEEEKNIALREFLDIALWINSCLTGDPYFAMVVEHTENDLSSNLNCNKQ
ncbi:MAG: hypothetical protein COV91_00220 [Candidatus Taylorbacteria bacterium CG11_big_fil_rev_8_21_14_0_20_46_11]|uniref:Uncharacterized protein n=1 Tax=Candidatus Taylorbacteria bacterium CG11_big_fil_rev_8_21_14_0_20_46_11 TaxID=1975025 RepID=A0A2H0KD87_9BACT|nr:MAG: hypothetical protein COV91_00220 [Candidatus Taylorbacteria bacterium CG11_big_fil_rev_8_21_14_0_20_46_11]